MFRLLKKKLIYYILFFITLFMNLFKIFSWHKKLMKIWKCNSSTQVQTIVFLEKKYQFLKRNWLINQSQHHSLGLVFLYLIICFFPIKSSVNFKFCFQFHNFKFLQTCFISHLLNLKTFTEVSYCDIRNYHLIVYIKKIHFQIYNTLKNIY